VEMVRDDLHIAHILTRQAFENAIVVKGAVGGSTNAVSWRERCHCAKLGRRSRWRWQLRVGRRRGIRWD